MFSRRLLRNRTIRDSHEREKDFWRMTGYLQTLDLYDFGTLFASVRACS
jgi:hypothetical protein